MNVAADHGEVEVVDRLRRMLCTGVRTRVHPERRTISKSPRETASETLALDGTRRKSGSQSDSAAVDQKAAGTPLNAGSFPYPFVRAYSLSMNAATSAASDGPM